MTKFKGTILIAVIAVFAIGCGVGNVDNSSLKGIANAMYTQMQKDNYRKAAEIVWDNMYVSSRSTAEHNKETKKQVIPTLATLLKDKFESKKELKSFEVLEETISEDGETATVKIKFIYMDDSEITKADQYAKQDGVWKFKLTF